MEEKPQLSIIVPVYNGEQYLARCLDSLVQQTYQPIEILIMDDGSTDGTPALCDTYAERYPSIRVSHIPNGGVGNARNLGMQQCSGEYVQFCDSDDWLEPDCCQTMMDAILAQNTDVACFGWMTDDGQGKISDETENGFTGYGGQDEFFTAILSKAGNLGGKQWYGNYIWNKIYRKEKLFDENGNLILFDTTVKVAEDGIWLVEIGKQMKTAYFCKTPFYHYFANPGSVMRTKEKFMETRLESETSHLRMLRSLKDYNIAYYRIHQKTCLDYFWGVTKSKPADVTVEFIQKSMNNLIAMYDGKITLDMAKSIHYYMKAAQEYRDVKAGKTVVNPASDPDAAARPSFWTRVKNKVKRVTKS